MRFCIRFTKSIRLYTPAILLAILNALLLSSCAGLSGDSPVTRTGFAFDTVVSITIYDSAKRGVLDKCFEMCESYEQLFSARREDSEVWQINHGGGRPVPVSFETASLIQTALFWCEQSGGMLDLTLFPVAEEWHISEQMARMSENPDYQYYIPDDDTLSKVLEHVDYRNAVIYDADGRAVGYEETLSESASYSVQLLDSDAAIDLGFIAKGYIADRLKEFMRAQGIKSGIISLGGNILLIGAKPDGSAFNVGIQKPFGGLGESITTVQRADASIVSSGCYERYFSVGDGKSAPRIYHHIFDAKTGMPVENDLFGVTVISASSAQCDALSTYCYILGLDKGLELIRSLDGAEAVFVTRDYEVITSF